MDHFLHACRNDTSPRVADPLLRSTGAGHIISCASLLSTVPGHVLPVAGLMNNGARLVSPPRRSALDASSSWARHSAPVKPMPQGRLPAIVHDVFLSRRAGQPSGPGGCDAWDRGRLRSAALVGCRGGFGAVAWPDDDA